MQNDELTTTTSQHRHHQARDDALLPKPAKLFPLFVPCSPPLLMLVFPVRLEKTSVAYNPEVGAFNNVFLAQEPFASLEMKTPTGSP